MSAVEPVECEFTLLAFIKETKVLYLEFYLAFDMSVDIYSHVLSYDISSK